MFKKSLLSLTTAVGLTALVATSYAQVGADQKPASATSDPRFDSYKGPSTDMAPGNFNFSGQVPQGFTVGEFRVSNDVERLRATWPRRKRIARRTSSRPNWPSCSTNNSTSASAGTSRRSSRSRHRSKSSKTW